MRAHLLVLVLLLAGCQGTTPILPPPVETPPGSIVDLRTGQALAPEALAVLLAQAPRVIVGEQHDNPDHHSVQLWLLRSLASQRSQGSLLLEMLNPAQQASVDATKVAINGARLPDDLPGLLAWQPGWDWSLYGPLVGYALKQPYPLLSANLDREEVRSIYGRAPALPGARVNARAVTEALSEQILQSHCGLLPQAQVPAMLAVQQQRDRRMAERLLAAPAPALLFAGAFHARKDLGVPLHLADLGRPGDAMVLMLAERGSAVSRTEADVVWFTPPQPEQDYCARLKR